MCCLFNLLHFFLYRNQSVLDGVDDQFGGVVDAELAEDVGLQGVDGLGTVSEAGCDFLVLESFAGETDDIQFSRSENLAVNVLRGMYSLDDVGDVGAVISRTAEHGINGIT